MIELKTQYPFVDKDGIEHSNLIKHYAEDENGTRYYIKQIENGFDGYTEAVDLYPCQYHYIATDKEIENV